MSLALIPLAALMALATYPSRALPLLTPGIERLPVRARLYLRLVGPSVLAALAVANVTVQTAGGRSTFHVGIEWIAVAVAVALMAWRRNLFVALAAAVVLVAVARLAGIA